MRLKVSERSKALRIAFVCLFHSTFLSSGIASRSTLNHAELHRDCCRRSRIRRSEPLWSSVDPNPEFGSETRTPWSRSTGRPIDRHNILPMLQGKGPTPNSVFSYFSGTSILTMLWSLEIASGSTGFDHPGTAVLEEGAFSLH